MVVEFLTFEIPVSDRSEWLRAEEQHWSRFLERQDGFVRKQIWENVSEPSKLHAAIWWESMEHWQAIPEADLAAVADAMGPHEREPNLTTFKLIRDC